VLRRIDDFLIDRVFQPVTDRLASVTSPCAMAAFLLVGFLVSNEAWCITYGHYVLAFLAGCTFAAAYLMAVDEDKKPLSNTLPSVRIIHFIPRMIGLMLLTPLMVLLTPLNFHILHPLADIGWWLYLMALYFMACRKMPPPKRETEAPKRWFAWQGA
jgi:hypothetical protein